MEPPQNSDHSFMPERRSRLTSHNPIDVQPQSVRSASQPPRTGALDDPSSPPSQLFDAYGTLSSVPWSHSARFVPMNRSSSLGVPQSVPTRSSSFSHEHSFQPSSPYSSFRSSAFASTFEDDESEVLSDDLSQGNYDSVADLSQVYRGRAYSPDNNRSRSQSLAGLRTTNTRTAAFPRMPSSALPQSWKESFLQPNTLGLNASNQGVQNDPRPSIGRISSYGGKNPNYPPTASPLLRSGFQSETADISNISPFLRDVNQIFVDDTPLRDLWGGGVPSREETWIPGSGNTSRRHSVSVVQPRRGPLGLSIGDATVSSHPDMHGELSREHNALSSNVITNDISSQLNRLRLSFGGNVPPSSTTSEERTPSLLADGASGSIGRSENGHLPPSSQRSTATQSIFPCVPSTESTGRDPPGLVMRSSHQRAYDEFNPTPAISVATDVSSHPPQRHGGRMGQPQRLVFNGETSLTSPHSPSGQAVNHSGRDQHQYAMEFGSSPSQHAPSHHSGQPMLSADIGKGMPLHSIPSSCPLYIVEFKAGRTDLFYCSDATSRVNVGDLVIVEADRGKDLGKVVNDTISHAQLEEWQNSSHASSESPVSPGGHASKRELNPKRIYGRATNHDTQLLIAKAQDEDKALQLCQAKVKQKKLPMEVIDAEYQWDRRKLTFYFVAEKRIDFRELVKELFRLYKTRIWMASLSQTPFGIE